MELAISLLAVFGVLFALVISVVVGGACYKAYTAINAIYAKIEDYRNDQDSYDVETEEELDELTEQLNAIQEEVDRQAKPDNEDEIDDLTERIEYLQTLVDRLADNVGKKCLVQYIAFSPETIKEIREAMNSCCVFSNSGNATDDNDSEDDDADEMPSGN